METKNLSENNSAPLDEDYTDPNLDFCPLFPSAIFLVRTIPALLVFVAAWNIFLSLSTIILNTLVFFAVRRNNSLRLPSKILLSNLILTDVGTGVFTQPSYAAYLLAKTTTSSNGACVFYGCYLSFMALFCTASLLTMTAIALDRSIAFFSPLKYKEIVTAKRVRIVLAISWSYCAVFTTSYYWNSAVFHYTTICGLSLCLLSITTAYIKIYRGLRQHHGHRVQDQAQAQVAATALEVAKYRRTASSMMWIYGLFLLCYLPQFCVLLLLMFHSYNFLMDVTPTLVLFNSSLNPLVYCFHLPEIRAEVIRTVQKMLCKNPSRSDK